jgi:hypothetical protein
VGNSFEYAKKLFSDLGRLAILVVLDIIPIVNLIVLGYMTRVAKETPMSLEPPPLRDYGDMFIQGLKVAIAVFLYMLVPVIIIVLGVGAFIFGAFGMGTIFPAFGAIGVGLLVVGIILAFAIAIVMAMAIVHMVKNNSFGKAFAVGEILGIIGKIGWGKYILWLIIMFVIAIVVGAIGSIPAIGWIISLIIGPIFGVFIWRSAALIYSEAVPPVGVPPAPPAPPGYVPPPPPPPTVGVPTVKFCVHCGAQIAAEAVFCPKCGGRQ